MREKGDAMGSSPRRAGRSIALVASAGFFAFVSFLGSRSLVAELSTSVGDFYNNCNVSSASSIGWESSSSSGRAHGDGADDAVRVIALCACCPDGNQECGPDNLVWDVALKRLSAIAPAISYAGLHQMRQPAFSPSCEDHVEQYVGNLLLQRNLGAINTSTTMEIIYTSKNYDKDCEVKRRPLNESIVGLSHTRGGNEIKGVGLHTPPVPSHSRRHISDWGEVFVTHAKKHGCKLDPTTIQVYRSRRLEPHQYKGCPVIHLPTLLRWAETIRLRRTAVGDAPPEETTLSMLTRRRSREEAERILSSKKYFCVLITRTTMTPRYQADGLIRHALARLLTKHHKPCLGLQRWIGGAEKMKEYNLTLETGPQNTYLIQHPFKFVIAMANEMSEGYLVEKTIHPYLAGSIAVTATPGVGKYVNANSLVSCRLTDADVAKVQVYYRGTPDTPFLWMPFNTTPDMWLNSTAPITYSPYENDGVRDEPVLEFVTSQWEEALLPCVKTIAALDRDDESYLKKLMQPYLLNEGKQSLFDGTYLATSLLDWYSFYGSPLVRGLFIDNDKGMLEQTPGWGVP